VTDATREGTAAGDDGQQILLDMMERSQHAIIESVRQWREAGQMAMPNLPQMPVTEMLPSPEEIVRAQFDFAQQLLTAQRRFAEELLAAMRPPNRE